MLAQRSTLTLQDVADLAHVQRHVVTMWRSRPRVRGRTVSFPAAVNPTAGPERFDRDEIVAYLETTGRGKNVEARQDAPALAVPGSARLEDVVTMLCLATLSGAELEDLAPADLVELAEQVDPADRFLAREVRTFAAPEEIARFIDDLVAVSYGPPDALARLDAGRLRRQEHERGLSDTAVALLGAVTAAARIHLPSDRVTLVPPADDRRLTKSLAADFAGVSLPDDARAARRRALIDGIDLIDIADAQVRVLSLVGRSKLDALEAVDEFVLSLDRTAVGVVLGSASVLCDPLLGEDARRRTQTITPGNLVMALRLPRGWWKAAHRQSLAVWVLSGVADRERRVCLADLDVAAIDLEDLGSDVLAALAGTDRRAYRYARRVDLARVLTGIEVLPRGVRATRIAPGDSATHLDRIHTATLTTSVPLAGFDVAVAPAPGQVVLRQRSLGELKAAGQLTVLRGNRIDPGHADPAGTVLVLAADGSLDDVRLDPFDAANAYPRATRTEPGDVIFLDSPRPYARVDSIGGALVATPSRVLRLTSGAQIGPRTLVAIINETAAVGHEWPMWSVPDLAKAELDFLELILAAAAEHQTLLQRHASAVHNLVSGLVHGVAAGAVTLDPSLTDAKAG